MFDTLSASFDKIFSSFRGKKILHEENISEAVRQVRLALLEADVNYAVVKGFIKSVKEKALGQEVLKSVQPGQQFIKVIHDELVALMGDEEAPLNLSDKPAVILLCGLQGSGKTTHCAKLAAHLKAENKKVLLAACDLQRPAAVEQLRVLAKQVGVEIHSCKAGERKALDLSKEALKRAKDERFDVLIVDTAGRLSIDEPLMQELQEMKEFLQPQELLFVANSALGQDAAKVAADFESCLSMTGSILTMLDSTSRAGAAISIRQMTGKPLKFEGIGERVEDFQVFNPQSMADRILGFGDTINLVKKAKSIVDEEQAQKLEEKIKKASITYEDYLDQMRAVKKMGPISSLLKMLPGVSNMVKDINVSDKEFDKIESIILSMTKRERQEKDELEMSRKKRIARGSGTRLEDVNKLVKSFKQVKKMLKGMPNMKQLKNMMGGSLWR